MRYAYKIYIKSNPTFPEAIIHSKKKITNKKEALDLLLEQDVFASPLKFNEDSISHWERTSWLCSKFHKWHFNRMLRKN